MATWHCKIDGKVYGPYTGEKLRQMAEDDRLLPEDLLREGDAGEWFPAAEMDNLFPGRQAARDEDDDFDDRLDRVRKPKKKHKSSNYYRIVLQNFQEGGQWTNVLIVTFGLQVVIPTIVLLIGALSAAGRLPGRGAGAVALAVLLAALLAVGALAVFFFLDVFIFGIPCVLLRVRLDPRRDSVLDLFAYSYLIGLVPTLICHLVGLGSPRWAVILSLLYPFFHAPVLAYLMHTYWGLSGNQSMLLAGIRFGYMMLFLLFYVVILLSLSGGRL